MSCTPLVERLVTDRRQELLDPAIREWMVRSSTAAACQVDRVVREAQVRKALQGLVDVVADERRPADDNGTPFDGAEVIPLTHDGGCAADDQFRVSPRALRHAYRRRDGVGRQAEHRPGRHRAPVGGFAS